MTKEELIKKEWIELVGIEKYTQIEKHIDCNGWCHFNYVDSLDPVKLVLLEDSRCKTKVRPIKLLNLENNNGWRKIESDKDLPTNEGNYVVGSMGAFGKFYEFENKMNLHWLTYNYHHTKITHYKPYISNPPKY